MTALPLRSIKEYQAEVARTQAKLKVDKTKTSEIHVHETEPRWFAVRTRFRDEKVATKMLNTYGVHTYLPIKTVTRQYGKQVRKLELPLINSFVFVKICTHEYKKVLQTEYVSGFLKLGQNILAIPDEQIELMRRLIGDGVELAIEPTESYAKGDWVEVVVGPLLGLKGTLVNIQGKDKMLVELVNSGYTLQISIDRNLLNKVEA